ncbi:MAG: ABC transporter ATP-binding protein, partial [Candidatus Magnetoglobus multicellularis str. Araruama]
NDSEDTKRLTIGRIAENDIVLNYPQVSSRHAILLRKENQWYIKDRNSTNGTFVNDRSKQISESPVNLEDLLFFGSYKIKASRLIQLKKNTVLGTQDYNRLQIVSDTTLIGRDPDADIHLDYPQISWHHVQLSRKGNQILLKDLGSTNGTFVNGKRISSCEVKPNDVISLGSYRFQVTHDQKLSQHDFRGDIRIDADNITVSIKKKTILDNISFSVFPTEFVGLMGPSGAGKTTLLMALNGYLKPTVGFSKINGESLYQKYDEFRQHIGYVPQDDIIHPELTVYEALYYTARLRLPRDIKNKEIKERINTVLKRLGLFDPDMLNQKGYIDIRDVQIGSPEKKGISGGQRKRVNLAMELLTEPSILFLDEPTSGLSSPDTLEVIKTLREIADQGKTIILTIHQPGLDAYRLMDNVIVVSAGKMAYYGPAYPDALEFFNEQEKDKALKSADSLLAGLKEGEEDLNINWPQKYQKSKAHQMYVDGRKSEPCNTNKIEKPKLTKGLRQLSILSSRYFRIKMKDYINTAILLLQAPII